MKACASPFHLKQWSYAGHPYLSGEIESTRLDVAALGLVPLKLEDQGIWTPEEHYWGEEDEPIEEWAKPIIARGHRQAYEMEQIVPGVGPNDFDSDPICESNDLKDAGEKKRCRVSIERLRGKTGSICIDVWIDSLASSECRGDLLEARKHSATSESLIPQSRPPGSTWNRCRQKEIHRKPPRR